MAIVIEMILPLWQAINGGFASVRGRPVPEAGPVLSSRIRQLGFLLADGKPGWFALEIESIEFIESQMTEAAREKE